MLTKASAKLRVSRAAARIAHLRQWHVAVAQCEQLLRSAVEPLVTCHEALGAQNCVKEGAMREVRAKLAHVNDTLGRRSAPLLRIAVGAKRRAALTKRLRAAMEGTAAGSSARESERAPRARSGSALQVLGDVVDALRAEEQFASRIVMRKVPVAVSKLE